MLFKILVCLTLLGVAQTHRPFYQPCGKCPTVRGLRYLLGEVRKKSSKIRNFLKTHSRKSKIRLVYSNSEPLDSHQWKRNNVLVFKLTNKKTKKRRYLGLRFVSRKNQIHSVHLKRAVITKKRSKIWHVFRVDLRKQRGKVPCKGLKAGFAELSVGAYRQLESQTCKEEIMEACENCFNFN